MLGRPSTSQLADALKIKPSKTKFVWDEVDGDELGPRTQVTRMLRSVSGPPADNPPSKQSSTNITAAFASEDQLEEDCMIVGDKGGGDRLG